MAQTSTRKNSQARRKTTARSNGSGRSAASSRGSTRNRQQRNGSSGAKSRSSGAARSRSRTTARSRKQPRSGGSARANSVKQFASKGKSAAAEGAQSGGKAVSTVAGKVKGPALAAGAALAGLAGGMAVQSKRDSGRKVLGMRLGSGVGKTGKNLADAGQTVGQFTENLGAFATEMRKTREAIDNRGKHRSPIEVLLQSLTARR